MQDASPSRTALSAAMYRAAHQTLDGGRVFHDDFALPIIGADARARLQEWAEKHWPGMRFFIAARSRFADEKLAFAVAAGTRQVVIVGAGLDTTALRNADKDLKVFEVDHPATQAWKRERLAKEGLTTPVNLTFAPVDFERETLGQGLARSGFDAGRPAFFIWLGVVPYLTEAAIFATLGFIASVPRAEVVFDYANPPQKLAGEMRAWYEKRAANAAAIGEPWISFFDTEVLDTRLKDMGAVLIEDLGAPAIRAWLGIVPERPAPRSGGHIVHVRWS
jgi:methyltransferase (TIGR00027 family)